MTKHEGVTADTISRLLRGLRIGKIPKPSVPRYCAAGKDGDCFHNQCPQIRDGEPSKSGRHCPLDIEMGES